MMYRISTELIKGQIRDTDPQEILKLVAEELEIQNTSNIEIQEGRILFNNPVLKVPRNKFFNKFASFSKGEITVTLHDNRYVILLSASINRIFSHTAVIVAALSLFEIVATGIVSGIAFTWITIFPILLVVRLVMHYLFFPVYFTGLRNNVQGTLKRPLN